MSTPKTALDSLAGQATITGSVTVGGNFTSPAAIPALSTVKEGTQQPGGVKLPTVLAPK